MDKQDFQDLFIDLKTEITKTWINSQTDVSMEELAKQLFECAKRLNLEVNSERYTSKKLKLSLFHNNIPVWVAAVSVFYLLHNKWTPNDKYQWIGMLYLFSALNQGLMREQLIELLPDYLDKSVARKCIIELPFLFREG